jgi:hypothetical protein
MRLLTLVPSVSTLRETITPQTKPGKDWFPYFRVYASTEAYFDKSLQLPDIERV